MNYGIQFNSNFVKCPYDSCHTVNKRKLISHLYKCKKNYPHIKLKNCLFNASHLIKAEEVEEHFLSCPDRSLLEGNRYKGTKPNFIPVSKTVIDYEGNEEFRELNSSDSYSDEDEWIIPNKKISINSRSMNRQAALKPSIGRGKPVTYFPDPQNVNPVGEGQRGFNIPDTNLSAVNYDQFFTQNPHSLRNLSHVNQRRGRGRGHNGRSQEQEMKYPVVGRGFLAPNFRSKPAAGLTSHFKIPDFEDVEVPKRPEVGKYSEVLDSYSLETTKEAIKNLEYQFEDLEVEENTNPFLRSLNRSALKSVSKQTCSTLPNDNVACIAPDKSSVKPDSNNSHSTKPNKMSFGRGRGFLTMESMKNRKPGQKMPGPGKV